MKPSFRSIKILTEAWIRAGAMDRAEQFLEKYDEILYESHSDDDNEIGSNELGEVYQALLIGYCQNGDPRRARVYLDLMIEGEDMEPDNSCYERILEAYVKQGDKGCAKKAQEVFELMERRRQAGAITPSERAYTSFIRCLARDKVPGLYKKAELLLQRMNILYTEGNVDIKPSIFTYNVALNACAMSANIEGSPAAEVFQASVRIFTELRKELDPDHVTFGNMLRCANLLPESEKKDKFVQATFQLCCKQGFVNTLVLRDLQNATTEQLWMSLTGVPPDVNIEKEGEKIIRHLPSSWSSRQHQKDAFETKQKLKARR